MATSYTPRLILPEMADGEGSGYVTFNELSRILDLILQPSLITTSLVDPPVTPPDGGCYYVPPAGATGAWAGHEGELAQWYNGAWYFRAVPEGFDTHNQENNLRWTQGFSDPYVGHVSVGHGGLRTDTSLGVTPDDITVAGNKITTFNILLTPEIDVESSIPNSTMKFLSAGLWLLVIQHLIDITPTSSNTTRSWEIYARNETDGVSVPDGIIASDSVSRYQDISSISSPFILDIKPSQVNKEFALYMRSLSGSKITVDSIRASTFSVTRLSHSDIIPNWST